LATQPVYATADAIKNATTQRLNVMWLSFHLIKK